MRILILNWRDIKNPRGGGAEILTHEMAKGWVKKGHEVTLFSSLFLGSKKTETFEGIQFIRRGTWWSVHLYAFFYYLKNKNNIDIIIDEVHWFPFFSAIYARKKTVALTCEVANKLFYTLFPYPLALFFRGIEKGYLYLYKNIPTLTISESTKKDLIKEGINSKLITVLHMGITIPKNLKKYPKEKNPTFIFLARLNKQKGIYDAIEAFSIIIKDLPKSKLWIVGSGEDATVKQVKEMVKSLGIEKNVKFFGYVSEEKKFELLAKSHLLLVPSVQEGWGLTVPEASTQKTPAIVYNVAGLRDVAMDTNSVVVLKKNNPSEMAKGTINLMKDKKRYEMLQEGSFTKIENESWDKSAEVSLKIINNTFVKNNYE
ncbi:MAG TPA: glycosyltransferase family 4 protein [Candidatus Limnocylindrales bacterium]|nr:glycosyltransferase family 4 protein [Candidatus Limnocylindrales bacterium]